MSQTCNVRVFVRFRPVNERERNEKVDPKTLYTLNFADDLKAVEVKGGPANQSNSFQFDRVFDSNTEQHTVFNETAAATVKDVLQGYNGTIFAYGQTGSGKTFTMFGPDRHDTQLRGIIPRTASAVFDYINSDTSGTQYTIKCSFLEIYREQVRDLFNPKNGNMRVRESPARGVWIEDLTEEYITTEDDILDLLAIGEQSRTTSATLMNSVSSRSHSLFVLMIEQKNPDDGSIKVGRLNLADLAGSEKLTKTGAEKTTLEEAKKINQSLSALGNCIAALVKQSSHVPFRDSKLTFILRESLGGNTKTALLASASPHSFNMEETLSTLRFAQRAKMIKTNVAVNRQMSAAELAALVQQLKSEIVGLKAYTRKLEMQLGKKPAEGDVEDAEDYNPVTVAQLQVELATLKEKNATQLQELQEREAEAQTQLAELEAKLELLESSGAVGGASQEELESLRTQLLVLQGQCEQQQRALVEAEKKDRYLMDVSTDQQIELETLTRQNTDMQQELENARKKIVELSDANAKATASETTLQRRVEQLSSELGELSLLQSDLEKELEEYQTKALQGSEQSAAASEEQIASIKAQYEKKLQAANAKNEQLSQRNTALESEIAALNANQGSAETQHAMAKEELSRQIKQLTGDIQRHDAIVAELKNRLAEREKDLQEQTERADTLQRELAIEQQRSIARKSIMAQQEMRVRDLETELSVIQEYRASQGVTAATPDDTSSLRKENQALLQEITSMKKLHEETMHKLKEVMSQRNAPRAAQVVKPLTAGARSGGVLDAFRSNKPDMMANFSNADMSGWLTKQGGAIKTWKRRWFLLKGTQLFYYGSPKDLQPIDSINVRHSNVVASVDGQTGKRFSFAVTPANTDARTYFMYAESEEEMTEWVAALTSASQLDVVDSPVEPKAAAPSTPPEPIELPRREVSRSVYSTRPIEEKRNPLFRKSAMEMAPVVPVQRERPTFAMPLSPVGIDGVILPCIRSLNERFLHEDGLFRISADLAVLMRVRDQLEKGERDLSMVNDPHAIAGALKQFMRDDSKDPVLTYDMYDEIIAIADVKDLAEQFQRMRSALKAIPPHHGALLRHLMTFLHKVAEHSSVNRMPAANLAMVFAPIMLRTSNDDIQREAADNERSQAIVGLLIQHPEIIDDSVMAEWRRRTGFLADIARVPPQYGGWLTKQGGSIKTWKRRWCVLKDNELWYYKNEVEAKEPQGKIVLDGYSVDEEVGKIKQPNAFRLYHPEARSFYISAESVKAKNAWMRVLRSSTKWYANFGPAAQNLLVELLA